MVENRVQYINHKGKRILCLDYSNLTPEDLPQVLEKALQAHKTEPLGSILCCVIAENLHFSTSVVSRFNALVSETKPYLKASAIVGVKGLVKVMYDSVAKFGKLDMKTFDKKDDALDWLAGR